MRGLNIIHAQVRMNTRTYERVVKEAIRKSVPVPDIVDRALIQYLDSQQQQQQQQPKKEQS